jgi:hypothetical protein
MSRVTPLRPAGGAATGFARAPDSYGQHRVTFFVTLHASVHRTAGAPYRSYRYALGAPPRISTGGARNP